MAYFRKSTEKPAHKSYLKYTYDDPLFGISFHPSANYFVSGLSTGQVLAHQYGDDILDKDDKPSVSTVWQTKRHKGSCRAVVFDRSGDTLYSIGSDLVVKKADSLTGKVTAKHTLTSTKATPTLLYATENYLLAGCEDSTLTVFDPRTMSSTHSYSKIHEDSMTSIVALETNKYNFVTTGSTTVAEVDIRKGVIRVSDDQEDEVLCGCLANKKLAAFGMSEGVVTVWNTNGFVDQQSRVRLSDESVDCVIQAPDDDEEPIIYAGAADGIIRKVDIKKGKVLDKWIHTKVDEVTWLDFDYQYRLVSANMETVKLWEPQLKLEDSEEEEERTDSGSDNSEWEDFSDAVAKSTPAPVLKEDKIESEDEHEQPSRKKLRKLKKQNQKQPKKAIKGIAAFKDL
ncbi:WD40 repeat-like protein [Nadsonia fulvescens var. elongata DSM 6958]|uniref:WD repeat-containing protein JIP5 n=1 Tax=Nadsonia fulvescens var. elongata DSM 6958 TaxID=857566 RepID=A0A1E3PQI2_9ASCO|nr:WD40 repeat-like protein [Nadsonia fulvescens var. elongata DSM 6958]